MNTKEVVASDWFQLAAKGRDGLEEFTKRHPVEMLWHGHVFVKNYMFTIRPPFRKNVRCMWIHGPSGVGKSKFAYEKMPSAFRKDPYTKWWDNYFHETQCIIDEFEPQQIPVGYLLQWLDPYPVYVEVKHGYAPLFVERFIITSNYTPQEVYPMLTDEKLQCLLRRIVVCSVANAIL
ncbi:hypothetical protein, partial [Pseudomonas aeruginosa]|uniref:hypothetical protein n=1 Tax=Pseudomonas aeruginosa TaxID=287 RepID=UPI002457DF95